MTSLRFTLLSIAVAAVTSGCTHDTDDLQPCQIETSSEKMSFGLVISDDWNTGETRSSALAEDEKAGAMRSEGFIVTTCVETLPAQTRSIPIETTELFTEKFGEAGFGITALYSDDTGATATYIEREQCTADNSETIWSPSRTYYWPVGGTLSFHAWAPFKDGGNAEVYEPTCDADGHLTLTHITPNFARDQHDLLVATTDIDCAQGKQDKLDGKSVQLNFKHALTAVKIQFAGNPDRSINRIDINGIPVSKAVYDFETGEWTPTSDNVAFNAYTSYEDGSNGYPTLADIELKYDFTDICYEENTFMMIPQTIPAETVQLVVYFEGGGSQSVTLPARTWEAGEMVVYRIEHQFIKVGGWAPDIPLKVVGNGIYECTYTQDYAFGSTSEQEEQDWYNNQGWGTRHDMLISVSGVNGAQSFLVPTDGRRDYFVSGAEKTYAYNISSSGVKGREDGEPYDKNPWQWLGGTVRITLDMINRKITFVPQEDMKYPTRIYLIGSILDDNWRISPNYGAEETNNRSNRDHYLTHQGNGVYVGEVDLVADVNNGESTGSLTIFLSAMHGGSGEGIYWSHWYESRAGDPDNPIFAPSLGMPVRCSRYFADSRYKLPVGHYRVTVDMPGETVVFEKIP